MKKDERNHTNVLHATNYNRVTLPFLFYIIVQKKRRLWNTSEAAVAGEPVESTGDGDKV